MTKGSSSLIEAAVQLFYFSAIFLGLSLYVRPEFFKDVVIPYKAAPLASHTTHSSITTPTPVNNPNDIDLSARHKAIYQDIIAKTNAFDPFVAFIPTTDENKQRSELPLVFISPEEEYVRAKAVEFCLENYHLLSITDVTSLQTSCADPVFTAVQTKIKEGKIFTFQEILERRKAEEAQPQQTNTQTNAPATSTPVGPLKDGRDIYRIAGTRNNYMVRLRTAGGNFYDISFDLLTTSPKKLSEYFCAEKANELKVTTDNLYASCVNIVEDYIVQKLKEVNAVFPVPQSQSPPAETAPATATEEPKAAAESSN